LVADTDGKGRRHWWEVGGERWEVRGEKLEVMGEGFWATIKFRAVFEYVPGDAVDPFLQCSR
jgi:hypothetical protein